MKTIFHNIFLYDYILIYEKEKYMEKYIKLKP